MEVQRLRTNVATRFYKIRRKALVTGPFLFVICHKSFCHEDSKALRRTKFILCVSLRLGGFVALLFFST